jgi:hypothetical protein
MQPAVVLQNPEQPFFHAQPGAADKRYQKAVRVLDFDFVPNINQPASTSALGLRRKQGLVHGQRVARLRLGQPVEEMRDTSMKSPLSSSKFDSPPESFRSVPV